MGYRGEDASRQRAESRRQSPWQSSSDAYAPAGDYDDYDDYASDDSYAGYDGYDQQAGQDQRGGAAQDGYGAPGGYGQDPGRGNSGYGRSGGYPAQSGGYPAQRDDSYGGSGGYPTQSGGYPTQADGHRTQPGGYGQSGGYPALPGGHGTSGGYPVLGDGAEQEDVPGRYAGNDWYGRPGGASGSGFADTGTYNLDARAIDSYGTGPRPQLPAAGVPHTGQQERYDDQFGQYPGYEGREEYADAPAYGAPQGYEQDDYGQGDYAQDDYGQDYDEPDDYADPYQDRYDADAAAPPAGKPGKKNKAKKNKAKKSQNTRGPKRGKRRLLLATLTVVVLGVVAAAGYVFVFKPKPSPASSTGPLPSPGSTSAATAACVKQFGQYCHIQLRTDDPTPLTLAELFPIAFTNEQDHNSFMQASTKLDKTCSNAVIGQDLVTALQNGKCTQVLRASYVSGDNKIMGTIGVANLVSTNAAHEAGRLVGTNDFVAPLSTTKGVASKLGKGTGIVEAEYKGHYLIMIWAEFASTSKPANNAQYQQLQQFGNDLIAGTANISLSQRMVNGAPATAGANPG